MAQITINEGLAWLKTLKKRHEELLALNDNAHRERRFYGASADKEIVKEPVYDVKSRSRRDQGRSRDPVTRPSAQGNERKDDGRRLRSGRRGSG